MADQTNKSEAPVVEETTNRASLISSLVSNPQVMGAFEEKLQNMVGDRSEFITRLPAVMKRRLKALKKIQLESFHVEAKYFEEVHKLECKFASLYRPIYNKRNEIIGALHEPTDEECEFEDDDEEEHDEDAKTEDKETEGVFSNDTKGIPEFWCTIFKNTPAISNLLSDKDEELLKCLKDVKVEYSADVNNMGFEVLFEFGENDFFKQHTLSKKYELRMQPDLKTPMKYEGPEIVKCTGCEINWKEGKDVTTEKSFFSFFNPPVIKEGMEESEEKETMLEDLLEDYDIGHLLQSSIVPKAVLYYTGEALDDDHYGSSDDDDDDEDEDENDEDYKPPKGSKNDCKQQ